jgi:hypothetical protein
MGKHCAKGCRTSWLLACFGPDHVSWDDAVIKIEETGTRLFLVAPSMVTRRNGVLVGGEACRFRGKLFNDFSRARRIIRDKSFYEHGTASPCCIAWHFDFMKMLFSGDG